MNLALFDFDGTITTHETMPDFMRQATSPLRRVLGIPVFAPILAGYKMGLVAGTTIRNAVTLFGFRDVPAAQVHAAGERFAAEYIPGVLRPEAMQRIAWHQARGDKVVLVSGGLDFYLAPWCKQHGLELICSTLETRGERLTGRYQARNAWARKRHGACANATNLPITTSATPTATRTKTKPCWRWRSGGFIAGRSWPEPARQDYPGLQ
jgi:phosphatidylglycerophosphatase C